MGVRGLATLARKRGGSTLESIDADTTLLIDGSGLCAHALQNQRCEYGGDLGALDAATTQFLERLLNRDFRVVVYLDGDQRRMKTHTSEERLAKRRDEWSTLERYADGSQEPRRPAGDLPRPALASRVFEACLRRLDAPKRRKLTLLQCSEEADQRMAIDACRRKALIVGNDSDFLVFRDVRYVELEHASRIGEAQVPVWTRKGVANALNLSEALFVEFCLALGNDYTAHLSMDVPRQPDKLLEFFETDYRCPDHAPVLFSRALYDLQELEEWPLDQPSSGESGAPPLVPSSTITPRPSPDAMDAIVDEVRCLVAAPGGDRVLQPILQAMREQLQSCLDDVAARALGGMLQSTPDDLDAIACKTPPLWSDVVAAYRYQRVLCESGLFRHLGAGVRADGPRNLYHGPGFHALCRKLRGRQAAPTPTTPTTPPGLRKALANVPAQLPIDAHRSEILDTIARNRVTIICGETGCGKSSRLPLMLLENDSKAKMFVSQPRRIAARALCDRVRQSLGDEVGLRLGFGERDESRKTRLWFCSTGYLVRLVAAHPQALKTHTHIIVDEVHERSVDTEILCLLLRRLVQEHPSIRVVLMSATVCVDLYASYFGVDPRTSSLHVGARRFPVTEFYADDVVDSLRLPENLHSKAQRLVLHTGERPPHASAQHPLVKAIVRSVGTPGSSILVFVPGLADILDLTDKIEQLPGFICTPIHSDVPFDEQLSVFQKTEQVRVILATNAAESGVTIPDCDHVIDLGTAKELAYNAATHRSMLDQVWISQSSAVQRAGRTGRVRPGSVYRLYGRDRYLRMSAFTTSEIHRQPLDKVVLDLMTLETDLTAAAMLSETVEPPAVDSVLRSYHELHASALITSPQTDEADVTNMGAFVAQLGVDLHLGRLVGLSAQSGMLIDGCALAATLSQPRSPWRIASPLIHQDPQEYNEIASRSFVSRYRWDSGMQSEPVALLRLSRAYAKLVTSSSKKEFCAKHNVVEARMRQLCSASSNLYRRALEAMDKDMRSKHDQTTASLQTEDPLQDEARLNRLRLLLTWTTAPNGLFQLYDVKHKTHIHRVGLTGPSLLKDHIATLFPPSVEYAFISGERHVYTALLSWTPSSHSDELFVGGVSKRMKAPELKKHFEQFGSVENVEVITDKTGTRRTAKVRMGNPLEAMEALDGAHDVSGVLLTVDLYQKTRNDLVRDCSPGFERRLVEQRNGADLCYAVHADGLVLLATPSGREAASDLILRLLQHGASCVAKEEYVIIKKKTLSKDEKKDLKSLLDVCTAFGVSFADYNSKAVVNAGGTTFDHARLEALLGLTIGDVSVQVLSGKQAIVFPSDPSEGLFETLPLGAQIVSALASGRRGDRIELWRSDDQALGKHELQVQVAQPRYMCSPWSDRRGECLMPHHTTVRTSLNLVNDQQLGVAASMLDLSGGGVRAESCTLLPSLEWLLKALTVFGVSLNPVPHGILDEHSVAACCRLCDAWSVIGESLQPQPDLVNRLDQIFGVESSEDRARRLADGEAALNVAAAPFPAPSTKKIYAKPLVKKDRWSSEDCARNQRTDSSCRRRLSGSIKTCEHREQKGPYKYRKPGVANKYTCGMITQDDGNEDIFYMTRGDAGLQLSEGLRVTYERTTNTRGPIAHYVKVDNGVVEAPAPPPPPKGSRNPYQRWRDSQYSERHGITHAEKRDAWLNMSHGERTRQAALIGFRIPKKATNLERKTLLKELHPDWTRPNLEPSPPPLPQMVRNDPLLKALPFCTKQQRQRFVDNDVSLDCFALLQDDDLHDLLGDDERAKSAFRKKYKTAAPVETAASRTDALLKKAQELRAGRLGAASPAPSPRRNEGDRAPAPRQRGTVSWFEAAKKHVFIQSEGRDVFVHITDVKEPLNEGDVVEFSILDFKGRPKAQDVVKISGPPVAKVERVRGTCLWYDSTRKMGFLKGSDGQEIFCHASDVKDAIGEGDVVEYSSVTFSGKSKATDVTCVERAPPPPPPPPPPTIVSTTDQPLEDEEPARVFLSIVSDVAGAGWIEDQQLGAALTGKGVRLALIHAMRAGALKRRWVEYGRRRLDNNEVLSTFDYVSWPELTRSQYLAPDMYLRVTSDGMRALGR